MSVQKVRQGEELPEQPLKKYLKSIDLIHSVNSELKIQQFSHGYSNLTYLIAIEEQEFVLRKPPKGAIKRGHDMGREFKVQKALKGVFPKVPKMYGFCHDHQVLGSDFYVMEKVDGIILNYQEAKHRNLSESAFQHIADTWVNALVDLHKVDYQSIGLSDLGKPDGYVARQVTNWGKQYVKAKTEEVKEADLVMQWMEKNQPSHYEHCLIHNDFKYDNVVFQDDSWQQIVAILDWEMATLGDPLMDLGTSLGYWTVASDHDMVKKGIPSPTLFDGNPKRGEIVNMYAKKSNRAIDDIVFYYVFGLFKIAVIAQQIYYRYQKGWTQDPRFANLDKASQLCCQLALNAIRKKSID